MKPITALVLLWLVLGIGAGQPILGDIPRVISFQGILKNTDSTVVEDGDYRLDFALYDAESGGTALWSETHTAVPVRDGIYNVILGKVNPLNIPFDRPYWLGMSVARGAEFEPRFPFAASPYSLRAAAVVDSAVGTPQIRDGAVTRAKIGTGQVVKSINGVTDAVNLAAASNNVRITAREDTIFIAATETELADGSVGTTKIQDSAITAVKVQDGAVASSKLQDNSVGSSKLQDGAVTGVKISGGAVVKSVNSLKDDVTLAPGANISITPGSNNTLTIGTTISSGSGVAGVNSINGLNGNITLSGAGTVSVGASGNTLTITGTDAGVADNAVTSAKIQDGAVTSSKIAASTVDVSKLQDGSVSVAKVQDGALTAAKIAAGQVVKSINGLKDEVTLTGGSNVTITPSGNALIIAATATLADSAVTATKIQDAAVTATKLSDGAVTGSKVADGSISTAKVQDGAITSTKLQDNAVTSTKIASGQAVKSINTLTDAVTLQAGSNVTITSSGNTLTIASSGGSGIPSGAIMTYAGSSAPSGWLICDSSAVSRTTYADLFGVIGTTYGAGDGATTFNLPNLKGKVPVGRNIGDTDFDALGKTGGEKTHTLTISEMPSHTHQPRGSQGNDGQGGDPTNKYWAGISTGYNTTSNLNLAAGAIANTGGGQPHYILPPYIVLNYIIKY
jgi:microcystin-dependent protein